MSRGHCCHGIAFQPIPAEETVCERGGVSLTHTHTHAHAFLHIHAYIRTQRHAHTYTHIHTSLIPPASIAANFTYHLNYMQCRQVPLVLLTAPPPLHGTVFILLFSSVGLFCFVLFLVVVYFYMFCFVLKSMANLQKKIPYVKESLPLSNLLPSLVYLLFGSTTSQRDDILILRDVQYVLFF